MSRFRLSDAWLLLGSVTLAALECLCAVYPAKPRTGIRTSRREGMGWSQVSNGLAWICLGYERLHRSPHKPKQPLLLLRAVRRHSGYSAGRSYQHCAGFEGNWPGFLGWALLWLVRVCAGAAVKGEFCGWVPLELQSLDKLRLSELHLGSVGVAW